MHNIFDLRRIFCFRKN